MPTEVLTNNAFQTGDYTGWTPSTGWTALGVINNVATAKSDTYAPATLTQSIPSIDRTYIYEVKFGCNNIPAGMQIWNECYNGVILTGSPPNSYSYSYDQSVIEIQNPGPYEFVWPEVIHPQTVEFNYTTPSGAGEYLELNYASVRDVPGKELSWADEGFEHVTFSSRPVNPNAVDREVNQYPNFARTLGTKGHVATLGCSSTDVNVGRWTTRRATDWTSCTLVIHYGWDRAVNDTLEIRVTDAGNGFATVATPRAASTLPNGTSHYVVSVVLSEATWGTGFSRYQDIRVEFQTATVQSNDNADLYIRGAYLIGTFAYSPEETINGFVSVTPTLGIGYPKVYTTSVSVAASETHRTDIPGPLQPLLTITPSVDPLFMALVHNGYANHSWGEIPWSDSLDTPAFEIFTTAVTTTVSFTKVMLKGLFATVSKTVTDVGIVPVKIFKALTANVINLTTQAVETIKYTAIDNALAYAATAEVAYNEMLEQAQVYYQEATASVTATAADVQTVFAKVLSVVVNIIATVSLGAKLVLAVVVTAWGRLKKRSDKTITIAVNATASAARQMYETLTDTVSATASFSKSVLKNLSTAVQSTLSVVKDMALSTKTAVVGTAPLALVGKIYHRAYNAVVGSAAVEFVRRVYTEVHLAAVGTTGLFSKSKTFVLSVSAAVASAATATLALVREFTVTVTSTAVDVGRFVLKVPSVVVSTTASVAKDLSRRVLATVGTSGRILRKFTDKYLATVGVVGSNVYQRVMQFSAVVGVRAFFFRNVIKPISDFAARVVVMVKRVTNSAVIQEPTAKTLRDCGDLIVIQGESMAELNLTIKQGSTFDLTLTWNDSAGNPIDLTGYTARMQIRLTQDAPDPAEHELTTVNGGIVLGGAAGTIQLIISSVDTAAFTWEEGVYDLEMISDVGPPEVVRRLLEGCVVVTPEVTR